MITVAAYNGWTIIDDSDDTTGIAYIKYHDRILASSEDAFALLSQCPQAAAQELRKQLVAYSIKEAGGADAFQKAVNANRIAFGPDFYDYLDEETLTEFAQQDIYMSYKI